MSTVEIHELHDDYPALWEMAAQIESRFEETGPIKHRRWIDKRWIDKGKTLNSVGRAPNGQWKKDAWAESFFLSSINPYSECA